jgi:hypothetical protein
MRREAAERGSLGLAGSPDRGRSRECVDVGLCRVSAPLGDIDPDEAVVLFYTREGYPNHEAARSAVERVAAELGADPEIELGAGKLEIIRGKSIRLNTAAIAS